MTLKLYGALAAWWPLLSAPADYAPEATFVHEALQLACARSPHTLLELGSGGGNNASHLKAHYEMTLVDLSADMLAVSDALNPTCQHVLGDMRHVRLGRTFDAVFIHDAVMYLTTLDDLRLALTTAWVHCRPGGALLIAPDCTRETFEPATRHGGHDGVGRSLRYLEWSYDPDPTDTTFITDYAYVLREGAHSWVEFDRHVEGVFSQAEWLEALAAVGFRPKTIHDTFDRIIFIGLKPDDERPAA